MNVNGDIVEFRGTEKPIDGEVYVNDVLIDKRDSTLNLPQGGTIRLNAPPKESKNRHLPGDRFVVKWPTGEHMRVAIIRNFSFGDNEDNGLMNLLYQLYVGVPECRSDYYGLLGNNDGVKNDLIVDDSTIINNDRSAFSHEELFGALRKSPDVRTKQEESCEYIAHPFGDTYQLNEETSLFPIQMTAISDSVRYPSKCMTLADASDDQIEEGIKKSKEAGISRDEMYSTVFDYTYANIDPIEQVDNTESNQPERTLNDEPDLNKDEDELRPLIDKIPEIFQDNGGKVEPKDPNPNTREKPETQKEPTNNKPVRKPRGGGERNDQ
jgi:hypothetical protein